MARLEMRVSPAESSSTLYGARGTEVRLPFRVPRAWLQRRLETKLSTMPLFSPESPDRFKLYSNAALLFWTLQEGGSNERKRPHGIHGCREESSSQYRACLRETSWNLKSNFLRILARGSHSRHVNERSTGRTSPPRYYYRGSTFSPAIIPTQAWATGS